MTCLVILVVSTELIFFEINILSNIDRQYLVEMGIFIPKFEISHVFVSIYVFKTTLRGVFIALRKVEKNIWVSCYYFESSNQQKHFCVALVSNLFKIIIQSKM